MRPWIVLATLSVCLFAQPKTRTIAEVTASTRKMPGYFNLYWDEHAGKMFIEVDKLGSEFLYQESMPAGMGSNDIGLDRDQLGRTAVVRFDRSGPRVLLTQVNYDYRANSSDADERRAVKESFAQSVLWGFEVQAEENGHLLVDATPFFLRDVHGVAQRVQMTKQGNYHLDPTRCAFALDRTKAFPKNTEVEAIITLTGEPSGPFVPQVTPDPESITVREHHSFVELPGPGFVPREFDPRSGFFPMQFMDFAAPVDQRIEKRLIQRHRLTRGGTITYYLDRGAPEPIRSALLDGARWWNQAFEAAGFPNGFKVELLPEDADPMDLRYNVINWVHRATRGWSYGSTVADPRTGEIIKGCVTLGSLRVRQDYMIAEGVLAPYEDGRKVPPEMLAMGLARLRQLAAHEVGHTLGLAHAYAGSTQGRSSVMDYPHPQIDLNGSEPTLKNAYATGIGDWDKVSIAWGYRESTDRAELDKILMDAAKRGLIFLTDQDARPEGSIHPLAHLWDNGSNAVDELQRLMKVRERMLARFGERNIRDGEPWSTLEDVLVPTYLIHRYQTEAAAKSLGGAFYTHALRGDGQKIFEIVPGAEQRRALNALLLTIKPEALTLPKHVLELIPAPAFGFDRTREDFVRRTGLAFDPLGAAETAANLTVGLILHPERASRLVDYAARDAKNPTLTEVIKTLLGATWDAPVHAGLEGEVQRTVDNVVLYHLMALASNANATTQAREIAWQALTDLETRLAGSPNDAPALAHRRFAKQRIERFLKDPKEIPMPKPADPPPGQPIGSGWN